MADDDKPVDETVESPKVEAEPEAPHARPAVPAVPPAPTTPAARTAIDRRSLGLGALGAFVLVLAFVAGMLVSGHDDRGDRFERMRDGGGGMMQGGGERGAMHGGGRGGGEQGMRGGAGMQGGQGKRGGQGMHGGRGGGMFGGGAGEPGGAMGRGGHGGAGVVESASDDELTVAPLGGSIEELTVKLDDDTEVKLRGDDGARDLEDADVSDIDEGDIVMVMGEPDDGDGDGDDDDSATTATIDAKRVVILRSGDE